MHIGLKHEHLTRPISYVLLALAVIFAFLFLSHGATLAVLLLLCVNLLLESNKRLLAAVPIDIEVLYAGVALLGAVFGFLAAFAAAILGPALAELAHLRSSREIITRTPALVLCAVIASAAPVQFLPLVLIVLLALGLHYLLAGLVYATFGFENYLRRLSTALCAVYVLWIAIPYASKLVA